MKRLPAVFYALPSGREPVRDRLKGLDPEARYKLTSEDGSVAAGEFGGKSLSEGGVAVHLGETESSDIILIERQ